MAALLTERSMKAPQVLELAVPPVVRRELGSLSRVYRSGRAVMGNAESVL